MMNSRLILVQSHHLNLHQFLWIQPVHVINCEWPTLKITLRIRTLIVTIHMKCTLGTIGNLKKAISLEISLNRKKFSEFSEIRNLINHRMNEVPLCSLCLANSVVLSWSLTQEYANLSVSSMKTFREYPIVQSLVLVLISTYNVDLFRTEWDKKTDFSKNNNNNNSVCYSLDSVGMALLHRQQTIWPYVKPMRMRGR